MKKTLLSHSFWLVAIRDRSHPIMRAVLIRGP